MRGIISRIVGVLGWLVIIGCVAKIFFVAKGSVFLEEGYTNLVMDILLIPVYVVLFPIFAIRAGDRTLLAIVYSAICFGSLLIVAGRRMGKR